MNDTRLIGKTIVFAEIDGFGVKLKFRDGSILDYDVSDPWFPSWKIIDVDKQEDHSEDLQKNDEELKPCPICGGKAILVSHPNKRGISPYLWWVKCRNGCVCTKAYESDHDAEQMWNSIGERSKE